MVAKPFEDEKPALLTGGRQHLPLGPSQQRVTARPPASRQGEPWPCPRSRWPTRVWRTHLAPSREPRRPRTYTGRVLQASHLSHLHGLILFHTTARRAEYQRRQHFLVTAWGRRFSQAKPSKAKAFSPSSVGPEVPVGAWDLLGCSQLPAPRKRKWQQKPAAKTSG